MNKAILIGRIGNELILKQAGDASVCTVSLATSEKYKDKTTGEVKEETEWHICIFWNKQAEILAKYGGKGGLISVEGKIKTRNYLDKDGQKKYTTEITASTFEFLSSGKKQEADAGDSGIPESDMF